MQKHLLIALSALLVKWSVSPTASLTVTTDMMVITVTYFTGALTLTAASTVVVDSRTRGPGQPRTCADVCTVALLVQRRKRRDRVLIVPVIQFTA